MEKIVRNNIVKSTYKDIDNLNNILITSKLFDTVNDIDVFIDSTIKKYTDNHGRNSGIVEFYRVLGILVDVYGVEYFYNKELLESMLIESIGTVDKVNYRL